MKLILHSLRNVAVVFLALAAPAFGGRMVGSPGPAELRPSFEPEAIETPLAETADDDAEAESDPDMTPEAAEGEGDEIPLEESPTSPPPRWTWTRSLTLGVSADDNINLSSDHKESDQMFTLGGNLRLLWGLKKDDRYFSIDYTPTVLVFVDHSEDDAFDQKLGLSGQWRLAKLTLGIEAGVQTLSGGDVDVGDRADRTLWQISLRAHYDYSTKTSFEVTLAPSVSDYTSYLDSVEWVNANWIDYQAFPKTRLGAGLTLGYLKQEGSDAQTFQQALVRITNPVAGKLTINGSGGVEFRQLGGDGGTQTTPVFRVGASYLPFDGTEVTLEGSRHIYSAASVAGENYVATGVNFSVRQRLFQRFHATFSGGYEDAKYQSTGGGAASGRHDQYLFLRPSASFTFTKWMNFELYYQYRRNASTVASSEFDGNVAGLQAVITF